MKWLRIIGFLAVVALSGCSNPSAPKYPDPDEEPESDPTDPDQKHGLLLPSGLDLSFLA
jgi:hypothetical protein